MKKLKRKDWISKEHELWLKLRKSIRNIFERDSKKDALVNVHAMVTSVMVDTELVKLGITDDEIIQAVKKAVEEFKYNTKRTD